MIEVPQNEVAKILNTMLKQSQRQHRHGIKAIIKTDDKKRKKGEEEKKQQPKPKCICPKVITKRKKKDSTIMYRRKHYNGFQVHCPVHPSPSF